MTAVLPQSGSHELSFEPISLQVPQIRSNEGDYIKQKSLGWMRPTSCDETLEAMWRRFEDDGYLLIKGLIPREDVLDMREQQVHHLAFMYPADQGSYFSVLSDTNILKPGISPRDGIFNPSEDPLLHHGVGGSSLPEEQAKVDRLAAAHLTPEYLQFIAHPSLRSFVRRFMGWKNDVLVKRSMLRHNVPGGLSTGIHYDRIFLRAGEAEFLTAWVPIGDCAANGGGLMYIEGSSHLGKAMEADFMERAKDMPEHERLSAFNKNMTVNGHLAQDAATFGADKGRWLTANYEAGDVVFHDPYMIHAAVKNEDFETGRIRLSTDLRFYEEGAKLDERWMQKFWAPDDGL